MKILIKNDMYNMCNRIKKFDRNYKIVYDTDLSNYQIYSIAKGSLAECINGVELSYICTIPFAELDIRVIKYLYDTQVDNIENILKRIDEQNCILENENQLKLQHQASRLAEDKLRQLTK